MSNLIHVNKPYKRNTLKNDNFNLKGSKQKDRVCFEHKNEAGNVAVIGRVNHKPYNMWSGQGAPNDSNSLGFCVIDSLIKRIFKKHYAVQVQSLVQKMNDLFPMTVFSHKETNERVLMLPNDGPLGIEWVVKIKKDPRAYSTGGVNYELNDQYYYASCGFSKIHGQSTAIRGTNSNTYTNYLHTYTYEMFVHTCCQYLLFGCGNRGATAYPSTSATTSTMRNEYLSTYFAPLGYEYHRQFTNPVIGQYEPSRMTGNGNIPAEDVELYGYILHTYDTTAFTHVTGDTFHETNWKIKKSVIHRLDNLKIYADEKSYIHVKNVTLADSSGTMGEDITAINNIDSNPAKGKLFHFKGEPVMDFIPTQVHTRMDDNSFDIQFSVGNIPTNFNSITLDGQATDYGTTESQPQLFNPPDGEGLIYRALGSANSVKMNTVPNPQVFKNGKYTNVYIQPGQALGFATNYVFKGYLKDFLKYVPIRGIFPQVLDIESDGSIGTPVYYHGNQNWREKQNVHSILCLERAHRHNTTEGAPKLEVQITTKRKAICTTDYTKGAATRDYGLRILVPPTGLQS